MDGYEVAHQMRQRAELRGVPLIALSGYSQEARRHQANEGAFDHHLVKPADPVTLEAFLMKLGT